MNVFNTMPTELTELSWEDYDACKQFFMYCLSSEFRQVNYNNDFKQGSMNVRIFWVDQSRNLGFAFFDDWKKKKVHFYRIGSEESWQEYKRSFAAQFAGDNS